jgi:hypothetical protein
VSSKFSTSSEFLKPELMYESHAASSPSASIANNGTDLLGYTALWILLDSSVARTFKDNGSIWDAAKKKRYELLLPPRIYQKTFM